MESSKEDLEISEREFRYDIVFGTDVRLHGHVDSDFAGDVDSRRSIISYVFTLGSGTVSWMSRLQKIVGLFTTGAEYVAARKTCKDNIWLKNFMKERDKEQVTPSLHIHSQSAIDLPNNPIYHERTKHIDVRYYFIHILLKDGVLSLVKIYTSQNRTNRLTKMVTADKLKTCSASVGLLG